MPRDPSTPAPALRNLGPTTVSHLARAGIRSAADLRRAGAVAAFVRLKRVWPRASLNALYALACAIDGCNGRAMQRARKLELMTAVEDFERAHRARDNSRVKPRDELRALRNIGPAMRADFELLGIRSVAQLARRNADALYAQLERVTGMRQDPCVWDTFAAAIHQARSGEALPWWHFTPERKRREREGSFVRRPARSSARSPTMRVRGPR